MSPFLRLFSYGKSILQYSKLLADTEEETTLVQNQSKCGHHIDLDTFEHQTNLSDFKERQDGNTAVFYIVYMNNASIISMFSRTKTKTLSQLETLEDDKRVSKVGPRMNLIMKELQTRVSHSICFHEQVLKGFSSWY